MNNYYTVYNSDNTEQMCTAARVTNWLLSVMAKPDLEERAGGGGGESREVGVAKANSFCDDIF